MNLYKITCLSVTKQSVDVYVAADDPTTASELAMTKMKEFAWIYDDVVKCIELMACTKQYSGTQLFIKE